MSQDRLTKEQALNAFGKIEIESPNRYALICSLMNKKNLNSITPENNENMLSDLNFIPTNTSERTFQPSSNEFNPRMSSGNCSNNTIHIYNNSGSERPGNAIQLSGNSRTTLDFNLEEANAKALELFAKTNAAIQKLHNPVIDLNAQQCSEAISIMKLKAREFFEKSVLDERLLYKGPASSCIHELR